MNEQITVPLPEAPNAGPHSAFIKRLLIVAALLLLGSIALLMPPHLHLRRPQITFQHMVSVKGIFLLWMSVTMGIAMAAIWLFIKNCRLRKQLQSDIGYDTKDESDMAAALETEYTCIKVTGCEHMIWLNGQLYDLDRNDTGELVTTAAELSFSRMSN